MSEKDEVSIIEVLKDLKIKKSTAKKLGKLAKVFFWFRVVVGIIVLIMLFLAMINPLRAKDFGVMGSVKEIAERDAIEEITSKLKVMSDTGLLEKHNEIIKERVIKNIKKPQSLNMRRTEKERVFEYDPSIEVYEDLKDARGVIFQRAGTRVNPLDIISLPYEVIFFDGEDKEQLEYVLKKYKESEIKPKLILTGGSPLEIEEDYGIDVYFDQKGILIKKLGIRQVPAEMMQGGKKLKIREVMLE